MISVHSQLRLVLIAMLASALALKQSLALAVSTQRPLAQQNTPSRAHKSELQRTVPPASSLRMSQQGASSLLQRSSLTRRTAFALGSSLQSSSLTRRKAFALGAAVPFATARPSRAVIAGYDTTLSEAHQTGAVALWIDLTGCDVCRHDVPAACSGTLIADDLVLSAQHCVDIPETLNGKLTKVVFGTNIFDKKATSVPVARYLRPSDVPGLQLSNAPLANDLLLVKLARPAPKAWRRVAVGLARQTPEAYSDIMRIYAYGDRIESDEDYTSGLLRSVDLVNTTPRISTDSKFLAKPLRGGGTGVCNGDSGGAALLLDEAKLPAVAGILSSTSLPCAGSTSVLINPAFGPLAEFVRKGSRALGTPVDVRGAV